MAETTVPMDDAALFQSAMEPDAPVTQETTDKGQPRDEHGRFAEKPRETEAKPAETAAQPATEPPPQAQPPTDKPDDEAGQVPSWRLRELREERDALARRFEDAERQRHAFERQLQQLQAAQKPKEPVDFFADPNAAMQQSLSPYEAKLQEYERRLAQADFRAALADAKAEYGASTIKEMESAVKKAMEAGHPDLPMLSLQMQNSADPIGIAMQWYKNQKLVQETGGDPAAYRQRILDEAMKDPAYQAKVLEAARAQAGTQSNVRPNISLPTSLNKASGTAGNAASDGDMSDEALFRHAMR